MAIRCEGDHRVAQLADVLAGAALGGLRGRQGLLLAPFAIAGAVARATDMHVAGAFPGAGEPHRQQVATG
ncbi:hypothetical protein D3C78_1102900 [compost metagenome]